MATTINGIMTAMLNGGVMNPSESEVILLSLGAGPFDTGWRHKGMEELAMEGW